MLESMKDVDTHEIQIRAWRKPERRVFSMDVGLYKEALIAFLIDSFFAWDAPQRYEFAYLRYYDMARLYNVAEHP